MPVVSQPTCIHLHVQPSQKLELAQHNLRNRQFTPRFSPRVAALQTRAGRHIATSDCKLFGFVTFSPSTRIAAIPKNVQTPAPLLLDNPDPPSQEMNAPRTPMDEETRKPLSNFGNQVHYTKPSAHVAPFSQESESFRGVSLPGCPTRNGSNKTR